MMSLSSTTTKTNSTIPSPKESTRRVPATSSNPTFQHQMLTLLHTVGANSETKNTNGHLNPSPPPSITKEHLDFWNHIINRRTTQLARLNLNALKSVRDGIVRVLLHASIHDVEDVRDNAIGPAPHKLSSTELSEKIAILHGDEKCTNKEQYISVVRNVLVCHFHNSLDTRIDRSERLLSLHRMKEILKCLDTAYTEMRP